MSIAGSQPRCWGPDVVLNRELKDNMIGSRFSGRDLPACRLAGHYPGSTPTEARPASAGQAASIAEN